LNEIKKKISQAGDPIPKDLLDLEKEVKRTNVYSSSMDAFIEMERKIASRK